MSKCKNCGSRFEPRFSTLEKFCWNADCKTIEALNKLEALKKLEARNWKDRKTELKKANKSASDYRNDLQKVFNTWIRLRDQDAGCISCGKPLNGKFDAGHFWSVGSYPNLRYDPDNCFGQCVPCNQHKHGNLIEYQSRMIDRIGSDCFAELERKRNLILKLTISEMEDLTAHYKALIKILKAQ
jgi:hypothetical protein